MHWKHEILYTIKERVILKTLFLWVILLHKTVYNFDTDQLQFFFSKTVKHASMPMLPVKNTNKSYNGWFA